MALDAERRDRRRFGCGFDAGSSKLLGKGAIVPVAGSLGAAGGAVPGMLAGASMVVGRRVAGLPDHGTPCSSRGCGAAQLSSDALLLVAHQVAPGASGRPGERRLVVARPFTTKRAAKRDTTSSGRVLRAGGGRRCPDVQERERLCAAHPLQSKRRQSCLQQAAEKWIDTPQPRRRISGLQARG